MPKWAKNAVRSIGIINFFALSVGLSFLADSIYRVLAGRIARPADAPYFRFAFTVMALIELVFLTVLLITATQFVRAKLSGANLYSVTVLSHFIYFAAPSMLLWRVSRDVRASIAAASGGTSGMVPFDFLLLVPFLYPVASIILVQLLKQRYKPFNPQLNA